MGHNGPRITRNCQFLITAAVCLVPLFNMGCDECEVGTSKCEGNTIRFCADDSDSDSPFSFSTATWHTGKCEVACRTFYGEARCVETPEPVPECATATTLICLNDVPTFCWHGYPFEHASCDPGTRCAMSPSCGAICAIQDGVDARCSQRAFCDENGDLLTCTCDLVVRRDPCGAVDRCHEMAGESHCTFSSTPDPRCGDTSQPSSGFCSSDNTAFACWFGFVVGGLHCGSNRCIEHPLQSAACAVAYSGV